MCLRFMYMMTIALPLVSRRNLVNRVPVRCRYWRAGTNFFLFFIDHYGMKDSMRIENYKLETTQPTELTLFVTKSKPSKFSISFGSDICSPSYTKLKVVVRALSIVSTQDFFCIGTVIGTENCQWHEVGA